MAGGVTSLLSMALRRRYDDGGQRTRRSLLSHKRWASAVVPRDPRGHALLEDSSQCILEGRQREVGMPAHSGAVHVSCPACHPVRRPPCWTVPCSPMPSPPRPRRTLVVDLDRHHSMRQGRLATPMPIDSAALSGKLARPWDAASVHVRVPERVPVGGHFPPRKSPISE